jgi:6,7-dimethyl-8-ribityllumazine synthase
VSAPARVALCVACFYEDLAAKLEEGARAALSETGVGDVDRFAVPGAFELPLVARRLASSGRYEAIVALGCVIRGDTPHFDYVAGECARGLQLASLETGVPIIFGVLTVETLEQALERAATSAGNKGGEAMECALEMAALMARL